MQILVYQDTQPQEDGSVLRPWCATTTEKHVASYDNDDPKIAAAGLVRWLKMAHDDNNERVPYLHHEVEVEAPAAAPVDDPLLDGYDADDLANLGVSEEKAAQMASGLPARAYGRTETAPGYPDTPAHVLEMWEHAQPFVGMRVPEGWEIRIFHQEG